MGLACGVCLVIIQVVLDWQWGGALALQCEGERQASFFGDWLRKVRGDG